MLSEQALQVARPMGNGTEAGLFLLAGEAAQLAGDLDAAQVHLQQAQECGKRHTKLSEGIGALALLGRVARDRGDAATARAHFTQVLRLQPQYTPGTWALEGLACVACMNSHFERAARLFGAADGYRAAVNNPAWEKDRRDMARYVNLARAPLGETAFDAAWAKGRAMTFEQAVAIALEDQL
jgi:non-specific serine/threonine protein kinase